MQQQKNKSNLSLREILLQPAPSKHQKFFCMNDKARYILNRFFFEVSQKPNEQQLNGLLAEIQAVDDTVLREQLMQALRQKRAYEKRKQR